MYSAIHSNEVKLGLHRNKPRIWLESKVRLLQIGFNAGCRYDVQLEKNKITLVKNDDGARKVSSRSGGNVVTPIIDLNSNDINLAFDLNVIGENLSVHYHENEIVITLSPRVESIIERETSLAESIKQSELSVVSLFTGTGLLDLALKEGFAKNDIKLNTVFSNELEQKYIDNGLLNNPALQNSRTVQGSIEYLHLYDIPKANMLVAGLPCVGFSKSGKSKNKISNEIDHELSGHLFIHMISAIMRVNPAIIVFENVPEALNSDTYMLIQKTLSNVGYKVSSKIVDSYEFGALEQRKRMIMLAFSENIQDIDILNFSPVPCDERKIVNDILDSTDDNHYSWSEMSGLKAKEIRDIEAGKGFRLHTVTRNDTRVSTIGKGYQKNRSTETKVQHNQDPNLLRLFTKSEHARIKGFNPSIVDGLSSTVAHEVLGNGVVGHAFRAFGEYLSKTLKSLKVELKQKTVDFNSIENIVQLELF